jgi:hypothetical protein
MIAITREDDFVSRVEGEWRNSSERIPRVEYYIYFFYGYEEN